MFCYLLDVGSCVCPNSTFLYTNTVIKLNITEQWCINSNGHIVLTNSIVNKVI